jgi:beta-glucanase (GH16 family)
MKRRILLIFPGFFLLVTILFIQVLETNSSSEPEQETVIISHMGRKTTELSSQQETENDNLYWRDNFESQHLRWDWEYKRGTGYKRLVELHDGSPGVEIGITEQSNAAEYSDGSLRESNENYDFGVMEARLRLTDDNGLTDEGKGTRGWGFWDGTLDVLNTAWFWSASPESDPALSGFRVMVMRNGEFLLNQEISVDMREWHTYRVELTPEGTKFYVDGVEIASISGRPENEQRIELWVDNMAVQVSNGGYSTEYLNLTQEQSMYIDWVEFRSSPLQPDHRIYLPWISR